MNRKPRKANAKAGGAPRNPKASAKVGGRSAVPAGAAPVAPGPDTSGEIVELDAAIALLRTSRTTLYRWIREGRISAMKAGRQWRFRRADLDRFLSGSTPRPALPVSADPLCAQLTRALADAGAPAPAPSPKGADTLQHAVELLIRLALRRNASDIHIAPCAEDGTVRAVIRLRRDGILFREAEFDTRLLPHLIERLKTMAGCDVLDTVRPQDGRMSFEVDGMEAYDLRASFVTTVLGPSVTVRLLHHHSALPEWEAMGLAPHDLKRIWDALTLPNGIILFTGPTGSGKTTLGYASVKRIARDDLKVMSIEDPVELIIPRVDQLAVRAADGLTFQRLLRSVMRSDPDVVLIGEIRDLETLETAGQVALTGHLVITMLHANDAANAFVRMRDMGYEPFLAADTVKLIESQRLVRILCTKCAKPHTPSAAEMLWARKALVESGIDEDSLPHNLVQPVGCPACAGTGYHGRKLIAETLAVSHEVARAVRERAPAAELRRVAISQGMTTMAADAAAKALAGVTSLAEAARVAGQTKP